jgi:hypothetical protein
MTNPEKSTLLRRLNLAALGNNAPEIQRKKTAILAKAKIPYGTFTVLMARQSNWELCPPHHWENLKTELEKLESK